MQSTIVRRLRAPVLLATCLAGQLLLAGCGGGSDSKSSDNNGGSQTAPTAPGNILAQPLGTTSVQVKWAAVSGATSYNLYSATAPGVDIGTAEVDSHVTGPLTLSGLTTSETRYYVVTAVNAKGESPASSEGCATPNDLASATAPNIVCEFHDEFGGTQTITNTTWDDGFGLYHISTIDNASRHLTAQNDSGNTFNADLWSRFDWTYFNSNLYYCQTVFDGASEAEAEAGTADSTDPTGAGCGGTPGFAWTNMTPD